VKCSEFLNELTNYLDGVLDARTKSELDNHLAWCHNCYVVCDTTRKTIATRNSMNCPKICARAYVRRSCPSAPSTKSPTRQQLDGSGMVHLAILYRSRQ
jgi:anti-sigma factor RsiW